jgi:diguanylate cyclase (GGDEF)-like protein/putative nucleotidyltransferase with HDIG domain
LGALTAIYFLSNSSLVAVAVGLEKNESPIHIWSKNFTWLSINYFSGASVAAVIVTYTSSLNTKALFGTLIIILPLLLVSYLTFRTAMGRVEDTTHHLDQLNRLYLSTIETLAMAIDAKDQVTHGHIRRVQLHATKLANAVGVTDDKLLKAIEAAALLHDMGKLAVPEYILNKPGKLTESEFEKMKLHASVGADILSAIDFPYPVVPIVRHHHESWDGSGYPSGIKGTDIPIGARILAVVDCFDALTSDRPYRPALSNNDALAILNERRGTMYDPMIVDAFSRLHASLPKDQPAGGPTSAVLNTISRRTSSAADVPQVAARGHVVSTADDMLAIYELSRALVGTATLQDYADAIVGHLQRLIPSSVCAFYINDVTRGDLQLVHAAGQFRAPFVGLRIPIGQRLSGWVAANRHTIVNSDAALDLGDLARATSTPLRSCMSAALVSSEQLVGVISFYSSELSAFNDDHRRIAESVAKQIAYTFKHAIEFAGTARRDPVTGLPHIEQLDVVLQMVFDSDPDGHSAHSIILIDIGDLKDINDEHGRAAGDSVLRSVVQHVRSQMRVADILFRNTGDGFVGFLGNTDKPTAEVIAKSIRNTLLRSSLTVSPSISVTPQVTVAVASSPSDGTLLSDLLGSARRTPQVIISNLQHS